MTVSSVNNERDRKDQGNRSQVQRERERQHQILDRLGTELHKRLKVKYREPLSAWLKEGARIGVYWEIDGEHILDEAVEAAEQVLVNSGHVRLEAGGRNGFPQLVFDGDSRRRIAAYLKEQIREQSPRRAVLSLLTRVEDCSWLMSREERAEAVSFIYSAILADGQPEGIAHLWLLDHGWWRKWEGIFGISESVLPQVWAEVGDLLPAELLEILEPMEDSKDE